jgi:hypothetical protein
MGRPSGSDMDEKPCALTQYDGQTDRHVPNDPELTEQIESDEDALQASLSGLAGMVGARGGNDLLTEVAEYAAQAIPGAEGLGVTVIQPPVFSLVPSYGFSSQRFGPHFVGRGSSR